MKEHAGSKLSAKSTLYKEKGVVTICFNNLSPRPVKGGGGGVIALGLPNQAVLH